MSKVFTYKVIKKDYELNAHFYLRKTFIDFFKPKTSKQFDILDMYSHIFINILYLKCRYQKKTEKKIMEFIKLHKNNLKNYISNYKNI
jgi:hypothetical protein